MATTTAITRIAKSSYKPKFSRKTAGQARTYGPDKKPIFDLREDIPFEVKDEDVKGATPKHHNCPAVRAMQREDKLDGCIGLEVARHTVYLEFKDYVLRGKVSHSLRDQLIAFDSTYKATNGQNPLFERGKYAFLEISEKEAAGRGKGHSPPDRKRGDPNSPKARARAIRIDHGRFLGREHLLHKAVKVPQPDHPSKT
jgi:hypothetical protein